MSKLLQALDQAIRTDFEGVKEAVMDKTYMGQLVAVQHQRGAQGGHIFAGKYSLSTASMSFSQLQLLAASQLDPLCQLLFSWFARFCIVLKQ